ncbi:hypothetical protein D3C85_1001050 [compost metagenome]
MHGQGDAAGFLQGQGEGQHADNQHQALPVDGPVGAVHVDAAPGAHQQAADQRGNHVGYHAADHQADHHRQADQRVGRAIARWGDIVDFCRQAQYQEVPWLGLQLANGFPGADHQQGVAELEFFFHQLLFDGVLVAAQADHVEAPAAAEGQLQQGLADQLRARRHRHFGHAHFL